MNQTREDLTRDKATLLERSQLARLQLRREARALRDSLHWKRAASAAAFNPVTRRIAVGLVISIIGARRTARVVMFAGRVLIAARLARAIYAGARAGLASGGISRSASRTETTLLGR